MKEILDYKTPKEVTERIKELNKDISDLTKYRSLLLTRENENMIGMCFTYGSVTYMITKVIDVDMYNNISFYCVSVIWEKDNPHIVYDDYNYDINRTTIFNNLIPREEFETILEQTLNAFKEKIYSTISNCKHYGN